MRRGLDEVLYEHSVDKRPEPCVIRYRAHGVQLVRVFGEKRNTEPVGPDKLFIDGIIAEIDASTLETIVLKAILADAHPQEWYDEYCNQKGYYDEAREFIRDIVWRRYDELRNRGSRA